MKITRIEAIPFSLPLKQPVTFALGKLAVTEHVLVRVHTDEGLVGQAEAPSRPFFYGESQASMVAAVERWFAPALIGRSPFESEHLWSLFERIEHNNTAKGALDIALFDLVGQALGQPCHRLLGGWGRDAAVTYVCGYGAPEAMAEEAQAMRERFGIGCFKLKVGIDPDQDVRMLHTVRRALPDVQLYVDGNMGLRATDALRVLAAGAEVGLLWAEEPCHMEDRTGRRRVGRTSPVPILGDESVRTSREVAREIADEAIHLVSIKVARTGFRQSQAIVGLCEANRLRPVQGSQGDSGVGVVAGLHFCVAHKATQSLPAELSFHLNLAGDLLREPLEITGGRLHVGDAPGLGLDIDPEALARFRVD